MLVRKETRMRRKNARDNPEDGKKFMYIDEVSKLSFFATKLDMARAELAINKLLAQRGDASLNDYYNFLGIPEVPIGDLLGWSWESGADCDYYWIDIEYVPHMIDNQTYFVIKYRSTPRYDYFGLDDWPGYDYNGQTYDTRKIQSI